LPVMSASCGTCSPQTVRYVPQTYYRVEYDRVPVVSYRAFTSRDTCTGCPVTTFRPVTSCSLSTRLVPYTSFRLVYSGYSSCGAPTYSSYTASSSCACGPTGATILPPTDAYGSPLASPDATLSAPSVPPGTDPADLRPTLPSNPPPPAGDTQSLRPIPDPTASGTDGASPADAPSGDSAEDSTGGEGSNPSTSSPSQGPLLQVPAPEGPSIPDPESRQAAGQIRRAVWRTANRQSPSVVRPAVLLDSDSVVQTAERAPRSPDVNSPWRSVGEKERNPRSSAGAPSVNSAWSNVEQ
jgi:hypothetical protein